MTYYIEDETYNISNSFKIFYNDNSYFDMP